MYVEKNVIDIVDIKRAIRVVGINLQSSGLPITFESLGIMWDRFTDEVKSGIEAVCNKDTEYGICLNKEPDYLVGLESEMENCGDAYFTYIIPAGRYVKAEFSAENYEKLVNERLMVMQKEAKRWAKNNQVKLEREFTVEVYPAELELEYPSMYIMFPIAE